MSRLIAAHDPLDRAFDLLGDPYRRFVIADLADRRAPVALDDLAAGAAAWAAGRDGDRPDVERVAVALHHLHLPRLADAGLLSYRRSERLVVDWRRLDLPEGWLASPSVDPLLAALSGG